MSVTRNNVQSARPRRKAAATIWSAMIVLGVFAAGSPAQSEDGFLNWIVKSMSTDEEGAVIQAAMSTPQAGTALMQGQRISTGPNQQMVLTNGRDLVTLKAGSSVEIGDNDSTTDDANLELLSGTVHVEAGKRTPGHTFSVEAPYLVATVKGTQFDVSTSSEASAVSVTEGVVGVIATLTRKGVDVTPGKTAIVSRLNVDMPQLMDSPVGGAPGAVDSETTEAADNSTGDSAGGGDSGSTGSSSSDGSSSSGSGGSLGGAVGDATGAVGGAVADATGAVGDAVGGTVGDAVSGVGGAVGGAVSGLGGALGGLGSGRK